MATAAIPTIAASVVIGDRKKVKSKMNLALKLAMIVAIPAAMGIGVLGDNILLMLFPTYPDGGMLLKVGAISIAFLSLCQIVTGVLQGIGKIYIPVIGALLGAVVKVVLNYLLISKPEINVIGAVISTDVCYLVAAVFNIIMLGKFTKTKLYISEILVKPTLCSIVMGLGCVGAYKILSLVFGNTISTLISILIGIVIYLISMLLINGITEKDLKAVPKGEKLAEILMKRQLMKSDRNRFKQN